MLIVTAIISAFFSISAAAQLTKTPELKPLQGVKRILFLGDSNTYGGGYIDVIDDFLARTYPRKQYELINLGLPSETVSGLTEPNHAGGAFPRPVLSERLDRALAKIKPDLVVACYGMNDGTYYPFAEDRFKKFQLGITELRNKVIKSGAEFWVMTPPPFDHKPIMSTTLPDGLSEYPSGKPFVGYDSVLGRYSDWLMSQKANGWRVIDLHGPLNAYLTEQRAKNPNYNFAPDGVHLNETGHRLIARQILTAYGIEPEIMPELNPIVRKSSSNSRQQLEDLVRDRQRLMKDAWLTEVGHKRPGMTKGVPIAEALQQAEEKNKALRSLADTVPRSFRGPRSDYHGFDRYDFTVDGCKSVVVTPNKVAKGLPWIWRAEFFDHRPELDLALLERGFHLAYVEVGNTFGAPSAMKHWDAFYRELTDRFGLSKKPTLEGLSRGGLYIYNWAAANPTKVSVLYGDNPVLDFKSWPGGKGKGPGSPGDWKKLQEDYGFKSEAEALAYSKNPIDNLKSLAKAKVPIIHLVGDADEVVPYPENTVILKERYEKLGGKITVIVKPGFKHHPHGLDDPKPLVDFIFEHTIGLPDR